MNRDERKLITHNMRQISRHLEFRDFELMKGTAPSFWNMESDREKAGWKPPMSERGHKSASDPQNVHFSKHVGHILRKIQHTNIYLPAKLLEHDPTALRRWRAGETNNDKEWLRKFNRLCRFVAVQLERQHPGVRVNWNVRPEDAEVISLRAYSEKERRWGTEHSMRVIAGEVKDVMKKEECDLQAAKGVVADRRDCSFSRVDKAWGFAQREESA